MLSQLLVAYGKLSVVDQAVQRQLLPQQPLLFQVQSALLSVQPQLRYARRFAQLQPVTFAQLQLQPAILVQRQLRAHPVLFKFYLIRWFTMKIHRD